jgi:hypothetical protein
MIPIETPTTLQGACPMNHRTLIKLSNIIGIIAIGALVYWVFTYIVIEAFDLRVFRRNMTEMFILSVLGILAIMAGALMINIMFNLTRIAERHDREVAIATPAPSVRPRKYWLALALAFPIIVGLLFAGNHLTTAKKGKFMLADAQAIVSHSPNALARLVAYHFDPEWVAQARQDIEALYSGLGSDVERIALIVQDKMDDRPVFLNFNFVDYWSKDESQKELRKQDFLRRNTQEEQEYLEGVFAGRTQAPRFSASRGKYELFYPYTENGKTIVFFLSDHQRYGKIGS